MSRAGSLSKLCVYNCTSLSWVASAPHPRNGDSNVHPPLPSQLPYALFAGALMQLETQRSLLSWDAAAELKSQVATVIQLLRLH